MGFSNILATSNMVAVKDGKVIVSGTGDDAHYYYASQDDVDDFIARDLTFGEILADNLMQLENINRIKFDDQEPVTEDKRVDVATIARNSEIFIYVEPQFVPVDPGPTVAYGTADSYFMRPDEVWFRTSNTLTIDGKFARATNGSWQGVFVFKQPVDDPSYVAGKSFTELQSENFSFYEIMSWSTPQNPEFEDLGILSDVVFPV